MEILNPPLHRVSPAAMAFFGHAVRKPPLRALRMLSLLCRATGLRMARCSRPLTTRELSELVSLLRTHDERQVVDRWLTAGDVLRTEDMAIVKAYAVERDLDMVRVHAC